jgi:triphosphoribosyl-dephospho-CoA synthase
MKCPQMTRAERAQLAMMLEVCAYPKPGNVDRCHDYDITRLEHFLSSTIFVRPAFDRAERSEGSAGELIRFAVEVTNCHSGGNTHFGAFILLIPLIMGGDIPGAMRIVRNTSVEDAIQFYRAFGLTQVRMLKEDELDVNDPSAEAMIRERGMTLLDVMAHSAPHDMVCREWINGFALSRKGADLLKGRGAGQSTVSSAFLALLATEPDTFIAKKHGSDIARRTMERAREVIDGLRDIHEFDELCIREKVNPGSIADIIIASIYIALGEGWEWDS